MGSYLLYSIWKIILPAVRLLVVLVLVGINSGGGWAQGLTDNAPGPAHQADQEGSAEVALLDTGEGLTYPWGTGASSSLDTHGPESAGEPASKPVRLPTRAAAAVSRSLADAEYDALMGLFNSTGGPNWRYKDNWGTSSSPCGWYGVKCLNGRVYYLSLTDNNLKGTIPSSLSILTELQRLDLANNQLSGSISASFSALKELETLNLEDNQLSGSIPTSFSALKELQRLKLGNNKLSGSIPASLSALAKLEELELNNNQLSGSIPASLSTLMELGELDLDDNQLSGCIPASLSALCGQDVRLSNNPGLPGGGDFEAFCASGAGSQAPDYQALVDLYNSTGGPSWTRKDYWGTGCNPCDWYGVECSNGRVVRLNLGNNNLKGNIPASLSALTNLQILYLFNNQLSGSIPSSLLALTNLQILFLYNNQLSGSIPSSLSAPTNLQFLSLQNNQLSGSIPSTLSALTNLLSLNLYNNQLSGSIPSSLSALTKLTFLHLDNNQLSGCIPASLSVLCGQDVSLSNNPGLPGGGDFEAFCAGSQTPDYQALMYLYNNTGGPSWTRKDNWGTGCSPCDWYGVECTNGRVTRLVLPGNNLKGSIPASLSALTNLQALELQNNPLSSSIPSSLSALTKLRILNLYNTQLNGSIPPALSALTNLQALYLDNNSLTGSIPVSLSALTNLQYLNLQDNQLSGSIPPSLSVLTNLLFLNLQNNHLSGCIPASLSALCGKRVNLTGNPGLPGGGDFAAFCARGTGSDTFQGLATASPNPTCVGQSVSLSVTAGTAYQWRGPNSFSASVQTPSLSMSSVSQSGLYSVTVANGSSSCVATSTLSLTVNPQPTASLLSSGSLTCAQTSVTLTAGGAGGGGTYSFRGPNGPLASSRNTVAVSQPGLYSVTVITASGCQSTTQTTVESSLSLAAPTLTTSATVTANQPISVTAQGCSGQLSWQLLGGSGQAQGSLYTLSQPGSYTLSASCSLNGCQSSVSPPLVVLIQAGGFQLLAPSYDCQTGVITFNTVGGDGSQIEYFAIGITPWTTNAHQRVETGLRVDPKKVQLLARQQGRTVSYLFDLPAFCAGLPTPPQSSTNSPPVLTKGIGDQVSAQQQLYSFTIPAGTFTDPEGESLTYYALALPAGLSLQGDRLSGTPTKAGQGVVTLIAVDPGGQTANTSFLFTVGPPVADLSPLLYVRPGLVYGTTDLKVVVDVVELNGVATSGLITLKISRDVRTALSLPSSATSVDGRSVSNSLWQLNQSDPNYYVLTTNQVIAGGDKLSVGLTGVLSPGATVGMLSISSVVVNVVGELKQTNNIDAEKIDYFPQ